MLYKWLLLFIVCLGLADCATPQQNAALECGAGGALGALLLCELAGGRGPACAAVTAGVGAAGAAACYSYVNHVQKHRQELAGREQDLDARIHYLREVNQDTEQLNQQLAARVADATNSVNQAVAAVQRGQLSQDQLTQQRRALDNQVSSAQTQVAAVSQELRDARQFRAGQSGTSADLDTQIQRLQDLLDQAQRNTTALAAQRQRI
jgi:hypothetical protein